MLRDLLQPERLGMPDHLTENAVPLGEGTDLRDLLLRDTDGVEGRQGPAVRTDDAQGPVFGVDECGGHLHHRVQHLFEVQFPPDIGAGATGGPGFHTTILTLANGFEQRNIDWSKARATYNIALEGLIDSQIDAFMKFWYARRGRAYGFRFKDWLDFRLPFYTTTPGDLDALPTLFTTDATTATFQISKVYADGGNSYTRPLKKIVTGTLALYNNASLMSQGSGGTQ